MWSEDSTQAPVKLAPQQVVGLKGRARIVAEGLTHSDAISPGAPEVSLPLIELSRWNRRGHKEKKSSRSVLVPAASSVDIYVYIERRITFR